MVIYLNLPEESQETFDFLKVIHQDVSRYYDQVYVVGNTTSDYDLSSFVNDNLLISILSALFVIIILLFTFQSAGLPVLLILVIQGSIWINFSFPTLYKEPLYFLSYLIVNSIQMTTNPIISSIGVCLSRGTIISIVLVLAVLPQILVLGDQIIERTSFELNKINLSGKTYSGTLRVQGRLHGQVNGVLEGSFDGIIRGDMNAIVTSGNIEPLDEYSAPPYLEQIPDHDNTNGKGSDLHA